MRICLSQLRSTPDVESNLERHSAVASTAASRGCALVVFPELSLTGYDLNAADRLRLDQTSRALVRLQAVSDRNDIVLMCGAPMRANDGVEIGLITFVPGARATTYAKQILHRDETPFFVAGDRTADLPLGRHVFAPAICYESVHRSHAASARERNATVYVASVAKPRDAIDHAHTHYAAISKELGIAVMVANAVGPSGDFVSAGCSAAWNRDGSFIASLGPTGEGELIVELSAGG